MADFVLDHWTIDGGVLVARFTHGPADAPVAYVDVEGLENAHVIQAYFARLEPYNQDIAVSEVSGAISIQVEYEDPVMLRGERISLRRSEFEAVDFERIAKQKEEWGKSTHEAWRTLNARVGDAMHLLVDQRRRLSEKAERHAADSTARQLYEQQISFIDRVLSKLDT